MHKIMSPMPGKITQILVRIGDSVKSDTPILVHEAMKMENTIFAGCEGIIQEIYTNEGDPVQQDQILLIVENC